MGFSKFWPVILAAAITTGSFNVTAYSESLQTVRSDISVCASATDISVGSRTEDEIKAYVKAHPFDTKAKATYISQPSLSSPYSAGKLSVQTLEEAVNALNCMRYIAGLEEVTLNDNYNELAQAASLVNSMNGSLSHNPSKPSGLTDSLYALGSKGAGSSNIGMGYNNPADSIVRGYMEDSDSSNIDSVGHRRWCLNPAMKQTGFGCVGNYTAMYAVDNTFGETDKYGVCWPAQNMPVEYFGSDWAWSVSVGERVNGSAVRVTLKRKSDNKTWTFSNEGSDGYFNVENSNYGQTGCIIFRPNDLGELSNDEFSIEISGLNRSVSYTVKFFYLDPPLSTFAEGEAKYLDYTEKKDGTISVSCPYNNCSKLRNLVIPSSLNDKKITEIKSYGFSGCANLKTICIPKSVTKIGYGVFNESSQLKNIYFGGSKQAWANAGGSNKLYYTSDDVYKNKTVTVLYNSACPVPTNPKYTRTAKSITLSWDKVSGAKSYVVTYSTDRQKWTTKTVSVNKITLTGLKSDQKYYFKLCARTSEGSSVYTKTFNVTTKAR